MQNLEQLADQAERGEQMRLGFRAAPRDVIQERFEEFHRENPDIYSEMVKRAKAIRAAGFDTYGIKAVVEAARYHLDLKRTPDLFTPAEPYKINNNYTALYARLIMDQVPELRGFFKLRERISARECAQ